VTAPTDATAVIERFAITWRGEVPVTDQSRLDRLCRALLDGALDDALEQAGNESDDLVCIRAVDVAPYRFRWEDRDSEIVAGWSRSIADAVWAAASATGDVVRYRSRSHAVVDAIVGAAAGEHARAWAWRQLGLWPAGTESTVAGELLVEHPEVAVWAIESCARAGHLESLLALVGPSRFAEVAHRAWRAAGGAYLRDIADVAASPDDVARAAAILRRSAIARSAHFIGRMPDSRGEKGAASSPSLPEGEAALPIAMAAAIVLEREPSLAARGDSGRAAVVALARLLLEPLSARHDPERRRPERSTDGSVPDRTEPVGAVEPAAADAEHGESGHRGGDETSRRIDVPTEVAAVSAEPPPPIAPRGVGIPRRTGWGGLLFLLHLVDGPALASRSAAGLGAVLHAVGSELLARAAPDVGPPERDDPALAAFAGLRPGEDPPGPPPDAAVRAGLRRFVAAEADKLIDQLRTRLWASASGEALRDGPESALLIAVCRRQATIEAEPGWVDVVLELDEVSTDVRRAGLDLDPGYLPWLGYVVRFRYV
jgi:hypothetical protein